ncbi:MAG: PAS domain S-box protein [Candidatus Omnitrophica bacterium]|nr:PAS domain S-box protein [Candidatus Omnitrophota bacterium]
MPDNIQKDKYIKFASSLTATIRKLSLYPLKHPSVIYSIKNLYSMLQEILEAKKAINISLSSDKQLLIEGDSIADKGSKLIEGLAVYFKKLDMESLTFQEGISDKEMEDFIRILMMEPEELKKQGDLNKAFAEKNIKHIKIAQFSYVKIQRGKAALEVDEEKKQLLAELKNKIKDHSRGKIQKPEDLERLQDEIIGLAASEVKDKKILSSSTKNIVKKFLLKLRVRENFFSGLKNALFEAGCQEQEVDEIVDNIEQAIDKKQVFGAKGRGEAGQGQEVLRRENQDLKSRVSRLEKEIETKSTAFEELKREHKKATQEKERIDNIVHHMAEGLVVVDPKGKIIMLNPVAEKLLGIKRDNLGMPLGQAVKDEHLLTMVKNITPDQDGTMQKDIELFSPDESTKRVLRTSSAVVEDHNGKTVGMVTTLNDITRQKEIERMKSAFVANVSHELRTPLATIQQNISLLIEGLPGVLNEAQMKFLNIAGDNLKRLRRLINDLLDSAAIEAGKFKLKISKSDLNERINSVSTFLNRWAQTKNITIETKLLLESEQIEMDNDRIEQVMTNLLSNAIKFTPEGGKIVVSALRREATKEAPQGLVEVSVKDSGPGITEDNLKRIFEKFERGSAVNSGIGGTGLGLSICQEIIKMHGGEVWVESKLDEGSTFSFTLPRALGIVL